MLYDSHCHLNMFNKKELEEIFSSLKLEENFNIDNIINNSHNNNIMILNNIATNIEEFNDVINLSNKYKNIFSSIGVHPEEVEKGIPTLNLLLEYSKKEKVIGIGETGFDYHSDNYNKDKQKQNFEIHIEASRKTGLPLIIHTRNADKDTIDILKNEIKNGSFRFLLHCFSSGYELCKSALDLGGYISLSGIITFKNSNDLREIVKNIPINRLLVETDSPFLAPTPYRGKINQPAYIKNIVQYLVDFLKIDYNIFINEIMNNFLKLFSKINVEV